MTPKTVVRAGLVVLGLQGLVSGIWATACPRGFYDDFPGFGLHWISSDGPYNEHLVRDYGALNLALATIALLGALWLTRQIVIGAAVAWIVYAVPHLGYHIFNVHDFGTGDQIGILGGLAFAPLLAVVVLAANARASEAGTSHAE